jgi:hypothetical protein
MSGPAQISAPSHERTVFLLLPEALEGFDGSALLRDTLASAPQPARVLLCLPGSAGHALATALDEIAVETQILLGPAAPMPVTNSSVVLRAPPDISENDLKEFALALADVVLMTPVTTQSTEAKRRLEGSARDLGKAVIAPGERVGELPTFTSVTHRLDSEVQGNHTWARGGAGRIEQFLIEALAYNWSAPDKGSVAESRKRLRKCLGKGWRPNSYFAPDNPLPDDSWRRLAPDRLAQDDNAPIVASYNALDRSAVYGSSIHRDLTWLAYFLAALAVLIAVAGHLSGIASDGYLRGSAVGWGIAELVILIAVVGLVGGARYSSLQERWTACRLGAEQLRIARMSLPLLVLPPALATEDRALETDDHHGGHQPKRGVDALTEVKRIVRNHGLPRLDPGLTPAQAARWVQLIVRDQLTYHNRNHRKLECAESRLVLITQLIFVAAAACVLLHFVWHTKWLLLGSAAGPALAAALHGTGTRLGIVHRAALSIDTEAELKKVRAALAEIIEANPAAEDAEAWRKVRRQTFLAAEAMGRENSSWHGLVRRFQDVLP